MDDDHQKRLAGILDRGTLLQRLTEVLDPAEPMGDEAEMIEAQLVQVERKIGASRTPWPQVPTTYAACQLSLS